MAPVLALPVIGFALTRLATIGGTVGAIATVGMIVFKIYTVVTIAVVAFWAALAYFAKDIFGWVMELFLKLSVWALEAAGVADLSEQIPQIIASLPPVVLDLWTLLGMFDNMRATFTAYAVNMALRSMPLVGGMFRG